MLTSEFSQLTFWNWTIYNFIVAFYLDQIYYFFKICLSYYYTAENEHTFLCPRDGVHNQLRKLNPPPPITPRLANVGKYSAEKCCNLSICKIANIDLFAENLFNQYTRKLTKKKRTKIFLRWNLRSLNMCIVQCTYLEYHVFLTLSVFTETFLEWTQFY